MKEPKILETKTEVGREVVKALIAAQSDRVLYRMHVDAQIGRRNYNWFPLGVNQVPWDFPREFKEWEFALAYPEAKEEDKHDSICLCFDKKGYRKLGYNEIIQDKDEIGIYDEGGYGTVSWSIGKTPIDNNNRGYSFRTRRHKEDCCKYISPSNADAINHAGKVYAESQRDSKIDESNLDLKSSIINIEHLARTIAKNGRTYSPNSICAALAEITLALKIIGQRIPPPNLKYTEDLR